MVQQVQSIPQFTAAHHVLPCTETLPGGYYIMVHSHICGILITLYDPNNFTHLFPTYKHVALQEIQPLVHSTATYPAVLGRAQVCVHFKNKACCVVFLHASRKFLFRVLGWNPRPLKFQLLSNVLLLALFEKRGVLVAGGTQKVDLHH